MTREDFWMQVYMASFNDQHYGDQAIEDANRALAAYDEALKKYGEACKRHLMDLDKSPDVVIEIDEEVVE